MKGDDSMTETLDDGWIPWHGGECSPVDEGAIGCVKFRNGEIGEGVKWNWLHDDVGDEYEIVAYKVMPARMQQPEELERFVRQVWTLLDGVVEASGEAIWADAETTVHEAIIEIVNEYRPELAAQLQRELEI